MTARWLLVVLLMSHFAAAHGSAPRVFSVHEQPSNANALVAATSFGVLLSKNDGTGFEWVCDEAIGYSTNDRPRWAVGEDQTLWGATVTGLFRSSAGGCEWQSVPQFQASGASDVVITQSAYWVTTARFDVVNGLFKSVDKGATFSPTTLSEKNRFFTAVHEAPSRPARVYVSAWYFEPLSSQLFVSDDEGVSFKTKTLANLPALGPLKIEAVDAQNPDIVYLSLTSDQQPIRHWLLKSVDGGESVEILTTLDGPVQSFSAASDRTTLRVSDGVRIFVSTDAGKSFAALADVKNDGCVSNGTAGDFVCANDFENGFSAARVEAGGLKPVLKWSQVTGVKSCSASAPVTSVCGAIWPVLQVSLGLMPQVPEQPAQTPPEAKPKGCASAQGLSLIAAVLLLFLPQRKRRALES
jgi:hypothetical protein